ncbi:6441_t:CDS:1, partial [Acaulospora morrowiae]
SISKPSTSTKPLPIILQLGVNNKEIYLKEHFIRGLSRDNHLEVRRCGTDLSLDELVAKLSVSCHDF